jgi:hypothetical protein
MLFAIGSSIIAGALLKPRLHDPQIFLFTGIANHGRILSSCGAEYLLRFVAWLLSQLRLPLRREGRRHIPTKVRGADLQLRELHRAVL